MSKDAEQFFMSYLPFAYLFGEMSVLIFCPFSLGYLSFYYEVLRVLIYFVYKILTKYVICK